MAIVNEQILGPHSKLRIPRIKSMTEEVEVCVPLVIDYPEKDSERCLMTKLRVSIDVHLENDSGGGLGSDSPDAVGMAREFRADSIAELRDQLGAVVPKLIGCVCDALDG